MPQAIECTNRRMRVYRIRRGFSLPELLVALLILAQIATFTIPKVLNAQQDAREKLAIRETIAAINQITYQGGLLGEMTPDNLGGYILDRLNAVKVCRTDARAEGCWTQTLSIGTAWEDDRPGAMLHNGGTIIGLDDCCYQGDGSWSNAYVYDVNGPQPPNLEGKDQMYIEMCFGPKVCSSKDNMRPGENRPLPWYGDSVALFQSSFGS